MVDYSSPSDAFARQAAFEARLTRDAEQMMGRFLSDVKLSAYSGTVFPARVAQQWDVHVRELMEDLPKEAADYLIGEFLNSGIADDVYTTAAAVLQAGIETFASQEDIRKALDRALSVDGFAVEQISASLGNRTVVFQDSEGETLGVMYDQAALTAAGFWDSLQESGSVWIKRIRRVTRTGATGLSGWITVTALRIQDYPRKRWVTRHDDHVRGSHRLADGQTVPVDQPFSVGGSSLMYPGERDAEYGEIVNCRCVLVGVK